MKPLRIYPSLYHEDFTLKQLSCFRGMEGPLALVAERGSTNMLKTRESQQARLIQFEEGEPLSLIESVEVFLYKNGFLILLTALGFMIALTVWISSRA